MDTKDKNQEQDIESYPQNGINLGKPKKIQEDLREPKIREINIKETIWNMIPKVRC